MEEISWQYKISNKERVRNIKIIFLAVLVGVGLWYWQKDSLILAVLGVSLFALITRLSQPTRHTTVRISEASISVDDDDYWLKDIKSFWIHYNPGGLKELSLELNKWYTPYLRIPMVDQDPVKIRTLLLAKLPEKEHELSMSDILLR